MRAAAVPVILGLAAYATVLIGLWLLLPPLLEDSLADWVLLLPFMIWLPALLVGAYLSGRLARERRARAGLIVGLVGTALTLRLLKLPHTPLLVFVLALAGALIGAGMALYAGARRGRGFLGRR